MRLANPHDRDGFPGTKLQRTVLLRKWLHFTVDSANLVKLSGRDMPYLAVFLSVARCALSGHDGSGPNSHISGTNPCLSH